MSDQPLIYAPAKRAGIGVLIMLAGASGSGKTKSALRLATGIANGGPIGVCDTEHGRALIYADEFEFQHLQLQEPFSPKRFEEAAVVSQRSGHVVWVCDSFSHEHVGPGGMLDMFEAELQRMAGDNFERREQMKYTAWIKPKMDHKHLLQRLGQLNCHIVLCCHAEKKLDLIKNAKGRTVPNPDAGLSPVCAPDIPYWMTVSFLLDAKNPGVPTWLKRLDKLEPLIDLSNPLDEATGQRIGAWARGDKLQPRDDTNQTNRPSTNGTADTRGRTRVAADELIAKFRATKVRKDHVAIVDDADVRQRIDWFRENRPEMFAEINAEISASWTRTEPPETQVESDKPADPDPPTDEGAL
jgi:hypothetical protein